MLVFWIKFNSKNINSRVKDILIDHKGFTLSPHYSSLLSSKLTLIVHDVKNKVSDSVGEFRHKEVHITKVQDYK